MCPDSEPRPGETPRTRAFRADESLSLEALQRIDEICLAFEDAWKTGTPPQVEQYLGDNAEPERSVLLGELLRLDLDYLQRRGEMPTAEQYQARFPDHPALIAEVFAEQQARVAEVRPPGTRIRYFGDYEILEEIAQGGMGIVYKARQLSLRRVVALKMIRSGQLASPTEVERFHREAEAAANLQHPNIVAIHEVGQHDGQHYFSMDFVEGQSLTQLIGGSPQSAIQSATYVQTIAQAIDYAHQRGVLHRDLKPANVLIDLAGQPRITDFGLAKRMEADSGLTHTQEILGTPSYMPPEQAAGHWADVGRESDVYSLGAILYELLTGRPPFCGETPTDTLSQVLHDEPIAPRRLNPKVPRDLETIALKCLEKERGRRYLTARDLAEELGRFQEGKSIHARPVARPARLWRWCKRNRRVAAFGTLAAALSLFLAVAGPIVAWYQASLRSQTQQLLREKSLALVRVLHIFRPSKAPRERRLEGRVVRFCTAAAGPALVSRPSRVSR